MRLPRLMLILLGLAATMLAADPFVGTWKMNPAKSKFKEGAAPKEQTVTIAEAGSDFKVKVTGTASDGSPISISYTVPTAGGAGKLESSGYDGISGKRMGASEREMSYMKGGKAVYTTHSKISADGNTLTVHSKGLNPIGKMVDGSITYEKQK
jgi:hypothetical protein